MRLFEASENGDGTVFARQIAGLGMFALRPLRIPEDIATVHSWVREERARYWGLVGKTPAEVEAAYREIARNAQVLLGLHDGQPAFLVECYAPERDALGEHYRVERGDRGMHVLIAPPVTPIAGYTTQLFFVVMDFLFSDPSCLRVVVEPDIRNAKIHALNRRAGFRYQRVLELANKSAHLAFCTREQYRAARAGLLARAPQPSERAPTAHLSSDAYQAANRALLRKAISELCHERLFVPRRAPGRGVWHDYTLATDREEIEYRFRARVLELEHWDIELGSIEKCVRGEAAPLDALDFVIEQQTCLGIDDAMLPVYLEELLGTLYAAAFKRAHQVASAADLVHADFQEIETAMSEGHPAFIANSGRVGFDARDYLQFAPEAGAPIKLIWLAAQRDHAQLTTAADLDEERLLREELGERTLASFERALERQGLDPRAYLFIPVHPWQWFNRLATVFAADIAERDLVCLGYGADNYRAQQSIRTLFNLSHPHKRYVKVALSILNMGFMRGLSADYMQNTPAINDYIAGLIAQDSYLNACNFAILREVAAVGYRNPRFEHALPKQSPYRKMLAALWRESPLPRLAGNQRLMTMAALLHRDRDGQALLPQLIAASGIGIDAWLERYLSAYLGPLLHCFYRHDLVFMPHGENVILQLEDHVPVGVFMKDIAEEAVIMDPERLLPERAQRIRASVPEEIKVLSIFTDVFDGILRYMAQILVADASYSERRFWQRVAACVHEYRRARPEQADKMARHDLFAPEFLHSCLNRLQLKNNQQMVDLTDPAGALQFAGTLVNPIAAFRERAAGLWEGA